MLKNVLKAVIFDLDGVLVHTDYYHYLAWKSVAEELNIPFDEQTNMRLRGVSRMACMDILLETYTGAPLTYEQKVEVATRKNERYRAYLAGMSAKDVSPEVTETLEVLRKRYKLAIGSSSKNAGYILELTGLKKYMNAVSDGNNITASKPDPEVFLKAAQYINVAPSEALVVEDAVSGIEAAVRGGFYSAAIGDAHNHPKADFHINLVKDLLSFI